MVSKEWLQEDTEERFRRTKFIMLMGPRDRHGMPHWATWKNTQVVRREKMGVACLDYDFYWSSHRRGKAGQSELYRTGQFE